jgi:heme exporter protein D
VGNQTFDATVWQALAATLTVLLLVTSGVLWRRRGPASGLRMLGVALLPAAAYLTGTLRLIWQVGDAVVGWLVRFTFSPFVWFGIGVALVALALIGTGSALRSRGIGVRGRASGADRKQLSPGGSRPAARSPQAGATGNAGSAAGGDDDLADIEAILKRHGIS